jgi:energy-coupling factor transporter transmembrane protein EcfT
MAVGTLMSDKMVPRWGFGIHPGIKFSIFLVFNILAFLPDFGWYRIVLLPAELVLAILVKLSWREVAGVVKILLINFIGLFLLFYLAYRNAITAILVFADYSFSILILFLATFIFLKTTPQRELLTFFRQIHVPSSFSLALMVAISFLPVLSQRIQEIIRLQQARGYHFHVWNLIPIIIPGVLGVLDLSMNLALSMEARGFEL